MEIEKVTYDFQSNFERQEHLRAEWVIEKARRTGEDVVNTLVTHMVNRALIEELTGKVPQLEKRVKEDKSKNLREWVLKNLNKEIGTADIAKSLDCSYDTAIKSIKENPFYFIKVRRGIYSIRDGVAEREEAKKDSR